ncbi:esterase/lipase family protein [Nucisporomicrobium flavum]|uniref:esterase/lipase family protein n=1 Tax=Nucisporomicrobium flavum TaxID=2785915 RepID=UPI001F38542F|nr:alpha/beta fold hydrolase [Nucisporomicrobium flavum]
MFALVIAVVAALAAVPATPAAAAARTPVVFVHGYTGNASNWTTAESLFRAAGYSSSELYAYEYNSYGDNVTNARGLATFVSQVRSRTGAAKVDIVNHSMGGLVSLWYVKQLGGAQYVSHLASLAGANHGTTSAGACLIFITCQQMYPGSSFIATLSAGDETPGSTRYATWYSPCDGVIIPYTSTVLSGATNNYVLCENHLTYLTDTSILTQVRTFLAS